MATGSLSRFPRAHSVFSGLSVSEPLQRRLWVDRCYSRVLCCLYHLRRMKSNPEKLRQCLNPLSEQQRSVVQGLVDLVPIEAIRSKPTCAGPSCRSKSILPYPFLVRVKTSSLVGPPTSLFDTQTTNSMFWSPGESCTLCFTGDSQKAKIARASSAASVVSDAGASQDTSIGGMAASQDTSTSVGGGMAASENTSIGGMAASLDTSTSGGGMAASQDTSIGGGMAASLDTSIGGIAASEDTSIGASLDPSTPTPLQVAVATSLEALEGIDDAQPRDDDLPEIFIPQPGGWNTRGL